MKIVFLFAALLFFSTVSHAQPGQEILSGFSAVQVGNSVRIEFTIEAGVSYCLGVDLERSEDGANFHVLDAIGGVCGGSEFEETYVLVDSLPLPNRTNYYRLSMGGIGNSQTISVNFIELIGGVKLYPNPVSDVAFLMLENPANLSYSFCLNDAFGNIVFEYHDLNRSELQIETQSLEAGLYLWQIFFEDGSQRKGRFIVAGRL